MTRDLLLAGLRRTCFPWTVGAASRPDRVGVEVEFLPRFPDGSVVPLDDLVGTIASHGSGRGWVRARTPLGDPSFQLPGGGRIGFEPGGQLEYSSPPLPSIARLAVDMEGILPPLMTALLAEGIVLEGRGLDPLNPVENAALQLRSERYLHMARYLAGRGRWGARMMRQSAAIHVNLDCGDRAGDRWRILNAAVPALTAIFGNSPRMSGRVGRWRSLRSRAWRELDPDRTGIAPGAGDVAAAYLDFALAAPLLSRPGPSATYRPAAWWLDRGKLTPDAWERHLTTLFPEVRPKGYFEVRTPDALPLEWCLVPAVLLVGLVYDDEALSAAASLLPDPTAAALIVAGRDGMADAGIARLAQEVFRIGLAGCERLGPMQVDGPSLARARKFFERFTGAGRAPADEVTSAALAAPA